MIFRLILALNRQSALKEQKVVILEGLFVLYDTSVMDQMNMKIFVDTDPDIRFARKLIQDTN